MLCTKSEKTQKRMLRNRAVAICVLVVDKMFLCKEKDMARLLYMPGHGNFLKFLWGSSKKEWEKYRQNSYHPWMVAYGTSKKLASHLLFSLQSISFQPISLHITLLPIPPSSSSFRCPPSFCQGSICKYIYPCYRFLTIQISDIILRRNSIVVYYEKKD